MALSDLTYENLIEMFSHSNMSAYMAHHTAKQIIELANRSEDLNTHEGRVNFAKNSIEIRQAILNGHRVKAVKTLWDMRLTGDYYFTLKDSRDAVYEAYGLPY